MRLRLIRPSSRYQKSYTAALRESLPDSSNPTYLQDQIDRLPEYLTWWREIAGRRKRIVGTTYWLVDGKTYFGFVQIRLRAGGRDPRIKSHIYYELRPSCRGQGLGMKLFKLAVQKARRLGIRTVLVSCDDKNTASLRIIEDAGGRRIKSVRLPKERTTVRLYEFKTAAGPAT